MQPDANDIVVSTQSFNNNLFKVLYDSLSGGSLSYDSITSFVINAWTIYSVFAFLLSALFIFGIVYAYIRLNEYEELEHHQLHAQEHLWHELHTGHVEDERWHNVQKHLSSGNPNDWKLAIIEADVLLERMLDKAGYAGVTIGDKLKGASTHSFKTLQDAWEAHRVRNQIAHGGTDFVLTEKVAKDTLIMYERVFKEFDVIGGDDHGHEGGHDISGHH